MAEKYNAKTDRYDPYDLPEGASCYESDFNNIVACAECGRKMTYGEGYTSLLIYTECGLGYSVCPSCYKKELDEVIGIEEGR